MVLAIPRSHVGRSARAHRAGAAEDQGRAWCGFPRLFFVGEVLQRRELPDHADVSRRVGNEQRRSLHTLVPLDVRCGHAARDQYGGCLRLDARDRSGLRRHLHRRCEHDGVASRVRRRAETRAREACHVDRRRSAPDRARRPRRHPLADAAGDRRRPLLGDAASHSRVGPRKPGLHRDAHARFREGPRGRKAVHAGQSREDHRHSRRADSPRRRDLCAWAEHQHAVGDGADAARQRHRHRHLTAQSDVQLRDDRTVGCRHAPDPWTKQRPGRIGRGRDPVRLHRLSAGRRSYRPRPLRARLERAGAIALARKRTDGDRGGPSRERGARHVHHGREPHHLRP